ncbi:hypothetical protein BLOT_006436 [Blomia tropicalis]|nr:hypothetical protein BLOT_006436 [Blomia tropicalis]
MAYSGRHTNKWPLQLPITSFVSLESVVAQWEIVQDDGPKVTDQQPTESDRLWLSLARLYFALQSSLMKTSGATTMRIACGHSAIRPDGHWSAFIPFGSILLTSN